MHVQVSIYFDQPYRVTAASVDAGHHIVNPSDVIPRTHRIYILFYDEAYNEVGRGTCDYSPPSQGGSSIPMEQCEINVGMVDNVTSVLFANQTRTYSHASIYDVSLDNLSLQLEPMSCVPTTSASTQGVTALSPTCQPTPPTCEIALTQTVNAYISPVPVRTERIQYPNQIRPVIPFESPETLGGIFTNGIPAGTQLRLTGRYRHLNDPRPLSQNEATDDQVVEVVAFKLSGGSWTTVSSVNSTISRLYINRENAVDELTPCDNLLPVLTSPTSWSVRHQTIENLRFYQVEIAENGLAWLDTELSEMLLGVEATAEALNLKFGRSGETPQASFNRVMFFSGRSQIQFVHAGNVLGVGCKTNNEVNPPFQSQITCKADTSFTKYTAVHELGHVFVGRTGGYNQGTTFFGLMNFPPDTGDNSPPNHSGEYVDDANNDVLFGTWQVLDPITGKYKDDWTRGSRGWGTGALPTTALVPCNFQQNPLNVLDWQSPQQKDEEVDEAAADMFLNWVYTKIGQGGFQNSEWPINQCGPGTANNGNPGSERMNWIENELLPTLASQYGF